MPGADSRAGDPQGSVAAVQQVMARAQRLSKTPRPNEGYPLSWYIEASFLGDITAISAAAIRSSQAVLEP